MHPVIAHSGLAHSAGPFGRGSDLSRALRCALRSRRAPAPSRSSRAWRCRSRPSPTRSCAPEIVGRVSGIAELSPGLFEVRIALAGETVGHDPGQLINMLFGNSSLHPDIALHDVELPGEMVTGIRRASPRPAGAAAPGRGAGARPDLLGPQAAGPLRRPARRAGGALCAGRHRLRQGRSRPRRPGLFAVRGPGRGGCGRCCAAAPPAMCRACRAISMPCGRRSRRRATPASIPSWWRR